MANAGFEHESAGLALRMEELFRFVRLCGWPFCQLCRFRERESSGILEKAGHVCMNSKKIYDICEFLHDIVKVKELKAEFPHKVSIHNSCHGVRELHLSSPSERNYPVFF